VATTFPDAYAFDSPLTLDAMADALNAAGPWTWEVRDSDTYGDYVVARPDEGPTRVRVIAHGGAFLLDVLYVTRSRKNRLAREEVERVVQDRVLPALQASNLKPTQGL
jgi:hypothetical protein